MKILLARKNGRSRLTCVRADGRSTSADLGPTLPGHDLAHFVVERRLELTSGFFIHIAHGRSIQELSDPATIRSLGPEPYVAEILARGVGALATGACTPEVFPQLVGTELKRLGLAVPQLATPVRGVPESAFSRSTAGIGRSRLPLRPGLDLQRGSQPASHGGSSDRRTSRGCAASPSA